METEIIKLQAEGTLARGIEYIDWPTSYQYTTARQATWTQRIESSGTSTAFIQTFDCTLFDVPNAGWSGASDSDSILYRADVEIELKNPTGFGDKDNIVQLYAMDAEIGHGAATDYGNSKKESNYIRQWNLDDMRATGGVYTLTVSVVNASLLAKLIRCGAALHQKEPDEWMISEQKTGCTVVSMKITLQSDSKYSAPTVTVPSGALNVAAPDNAAISWSYSHPIGKTQSAIDVQIRRSGSQADSDWVSVATNLSRAVANYSFVPKNYVTLYAPDTLWEVRVRAKSADSAWSEWASGTVRVIVPRAANLSPSGGSSVLIEDDVRLSWTVVCTADGAAVPITNKTAYCDLQYSTDGGESWRALRSNQQASVSGSTYYYVAAAGTFPVGIIQWRVRFRYTTNGAQDEFVFEAFTIRVNPSTSAVECDGKPHPTLTWVSAQQIAFQVRFADFDSGVCYGSEQTFTVPYVYPDGEYAVSVRTQASDGSWSAWTETEYVTITNVPITGTVTLTAAATAHAVLLTWTTIPETISILYRDGVMIYMGFDGETSYTDVYANGSVSYQVRAVASSEYYAESAVAAVDAVPVSDCLYDGENWYDLRLSARPRERSWQQSQEVVYRNYAGREKPVAFTAGHVSRGFSGNYVLLNRAEANRVMALTGRAVLFKDTDGGVIYGILNDVSVLAKKKTVEIGFTITEIDRSEEV